ncbi:MAG: hypothetical protein SGJ27_17045 [Candidatus Melainabacteria bacterium]|nr:hypothetical protein [Candidatus Melainabacteria bacterium]
MPAPSTSVTTGNVPSATSLLGFNPKLLASAPRTYVNTNINMAPAAVPQFYSAPPVLSARSHQLFGQPAQPTPIRATVPAAVNRAPQVVAVNNVSGKLSTPLRSARSGSMAPQFRKPKQVNSAPPKIAKYGEHLYSPGATKPTSSEIYSTSEVNGKMLPINKRVN